MGPPPISAKPRNVEECASREVYELGRIVAEARVARGFTQAQLAETADIAVQTLKVIEASKRGYSILSLVKVLDALGMELEVMDS
jgi:transcriptional regulator with XRE-family HTH domain